LMGIPYRFVIGERGLAEGTVEFKARTDTEASAVALSDVLEFVRKLA